MKGLICAVVLLVSVGICNAQSTDSIKFDEFGGVSLEDEHGRLDEFANELKTQPQAQVYVLSYGGRSSCVGAALKNAARVKSYLIREQQIAESRIVTIDAGYKEGDTFELWIVPSGAAPPNVSPSVDASEVVRPRSCYKTTKKPTAKSKSTAKPKTSTKSKQWAG